MTTLSAAAARRASRQCRRVLLRSRPGASVSSALLDGCNDDAEARCGVSRPIPFVQKQCSSSASSFPPISCAIDRLGDFIKRGSSSSKPESAPAEKDDSARRRSKLDPPSPVESNSSGRGSKATAELSLAAEALPPLTAGEYDPQTIVSQISIASRWNQGRKRGEPNSNVVRNNKNSKNYIDKAHRQYEARKWDYESSRLALDNYERHLQYVLDFLTAREKKEGDSPKMKEQPSSSAELFLDIHPDGERSTATHKLLSPETLAAAVRALTRTKMDTPLLSRRIRDIEKLVGSIGWTPITEELSYRLLETNGKAGNVRRTLALLELRRRRGYAPRELPEKPYYYGPQGGRDDASDDNEENEEQDVEVSENDDDGTSQAEQNDAEPILPGEREFLQAITSIQSSQLTLRRSRNIYLHESSLSETSLDNPTRYLDAILLNMSQRGVPLRPTMAARMLACYASSGRTGRATHYFYKVVRDPIEEDGYYIPGPHPTNLGKEELEEWKEEKRRVGAGRVVVTGFEKDGDKNDDASAEKDDSIMMDGGSQDGQLDPYQEKTKVRMIMRPPPSFQKIPSLVKDKSIPYESAFRSSTKMAPSQESNQDKMRKKQTKYEWELEREYSLSLTAAFAFADSLSHGACGHDPIELDVAGWNCLIKACCYRGASHRALKILDETMPRRGIEPDVYSYNTVLSGLARLGDVASLKEYLQNMTNDNRVGIDKYTVQAMVDGFLNVGDINGASSMVQDIFNQHDTLPPYTTHLKIIEFALSNGLVYEAKRHVYFIQQLWKWTPSQHHDETFVKTVERTRKNPKLSRKALQKMFCYFHEELNDEDFF